MFLCIEYNIFSFPVDTFNIFSIFVCFCLNLIRKESCSLEYNLFSLSFSFSFLLLFTPRPSLRQVITPDTFKGLRALERLDLHKNRIEVIGDLTFQDLQALRVLDLQENSLKYIAPKSFFGLANLLQLNLQVRRCQSTCC